MARKKVRLQEAVFTAKYQEAQRPFEVMLCVGLGSWAEHSASSGFQLFSHLLLSAQHPRMASPNASTREAAQNKRQHKSNFVSISPELLYVAQ